VTQILGASGGTFVLEAGPSGGTVAVVTMPSIDGMARGPVDPWTIATNSGT
jgi:hypothetical protein